MNDGAQMGVTAGRALDSIIGGAEQPNENERMGVGEMRDWLLAAPTAAEFLQTFAQAEPTEDGYSECARVVAGEILRWAIADPTRFARSRDPYFDLKADGIDLGALGITGFQWGWALNAARRCLELPGLPNPAIATIPVDE